MKRRLISMLLIICMLLTMLPLQVFAAEAQSGVKIPFVDVKKRDWHYDAVQYVYENGIFNGMSTTNFEPDGPMTRGMFVTVLGRMAGVDKDKYGGQSAFTDVPAKEYYAPYVAWAAKYGITNGIGDGKFAPAANVTRQEMATFFVRYFETFGIDYETDANITTTPPDIGSVADYAKDSVLKLWKTGLVIGDGTGFKPLDKATRAQAATLCMRTHQTVETWYSEPDQEPDQKPDQEPDQEPDKTTYYEVKFAMGTGMSSEGVTLPETKLYEADTKIASIPTPWKDGGIFLGWYYDAAMTQAVETGDGITRNMTLYAKMADATADLSGVETPNYITVTVPADKVSSYSFGISGYTSDCVVGFINVTATNSDMTYTMAGTTVKTELAQGQTYRMELKEDSGVSFIVDGVTQPSSIRVLNIITEKAEVVNMTLDSGVKYLLSSKVSNMTGTALDGLFSATVSAQSQSTVTQNENVGTFTYTGSEEILVGDTVAIYSGTRPDKRDNNTNNDGAVAYVEITKISGDTYSYQTADSQDVLFTPDVLPVAATADQDAVEGQITVSLDTMDFSSDVYAQMGLDSQTTIDEGDFIAFYNGDLETGTKAGYGEIIGVTRGDENYVITYVAAAETDVLAAMDIYDTRNEEVELTEQEIAAIEADMVAQALESGFVEEAASYLTALAIETDGFQELSDDMDMDISSVSLTYADGTPVGEEAPLLMASKAKITSQDVNATVAAGKVLQHFEDSYGIRVELSMNFTVEIGGKLEIILQAIFEEEVLLNVNTSGGAVWKWKWIFPYIYDYQLNANIDVGTYTGIGITATAKTKGEEDEAFDWKPVSGNKYEEKLIDIGKQITDLMEKKDEFLGEKVVDENGEEVEWAGTVGGGLAEKYSAMMEDAEESWIEILRVEIFSADGHVDPLHILCYGIGADFVVKANMYITMGMTFEYGVAKRYNFSIKLFHKQSTSETIDLEEAHYNFDFYVMGTLGIRAGLELEVAVGLFSLKLDSVGICAKVGAYAQLWGYFYYHLSWTESGGKDTSCSGALVIEIGLYLTVSFKAQLFSCDKLTYQPTLYENEWPLLTIGAVENVYDFAYENDDDMLSMEVQGAKTFYLPSELFAMNYMDMKSGDMYGTDSDDEDDDGEPDNPAGNYDDEKESHYLIELSNKKFSYDPAANAVTVNSGGSVEEDCEIKITWLDGALSFTNQSISRTLTIAWSDPGNARFISFNSMGGSGVPILTAGAGAAITAPTSPTKLGYNFGGWYTDSALTQAFDFPGTMPNYPATRDGKGITVYAKWMPRNDTKYTVKHWQEKLNGTYSLTETKTMTGTTDGMTAATANSYTGYHTTVTQEKIAPDGSTVVNIYYKRNTYTIKFTYGDFKSTDNGDLTYRAKYGSTIYAPTLMLGGYDFVSFTGLSTNSDGSYTVLGDKTFHATWTPRSDTPFRVEHYIQRTSDTTSYIMSGDEAIQSATGTTDSTIDVDSYVLKQAGFTHKKTTVDGEEVTAENPATISADGKTVVKIYYDRNSYKLTYDVDGVKTEKDVLYGTLLQMPTQPTKTGYTFAGWYTEAEGGKKFSFTNAAMPTENVTLYARWTANENTRYNVIHWQQNLDDDDYTQVVAESKYGKTGGTTAAEAKDYSTIGFQEANAFEQTTIAADGSTVINIYYDRRTYDVTFDEDGGSAVAAQNGIRHGALVTEPAAPTKTGYTFTGWYNGTAKWDFSKAVTENIALTAKWTANTDTAYTVKHYTQNINDDEYTLAETEDLTGTTAQQTAAMAKDYSSYGFETAKEFEQTAIAADGSTVIEIYYDRKVYDVSILQDGQSIYDAELRHGAVIPAPTTPEKAGYTFYGWYIGEDTTETWSFENTVSGPITLYGSLTPNSDTAYTVEYYVMDTEGNYPTAASITDSLTGTTDATVNADTTVQTGFSFDEGNESNVLSGTVAADGSLTLKVYVARNKYTATFYYDNDTTNSEQIDFYYDQAITPPATNPTRDGYNFAGWGVTDFGKMTEKGMTFTARWTGWNYTVEFNANLPTDIDASTLTGTMADQSLVYGTSTALTTNIYALPNSGYSFIGWSTAQDDTVEYNDAQKVDIKPAQDGAIITLYAVWKQGANVGYTVKHHFMNLDGETYTVEEETISSGIVGTTTNAVAKNETGFTVGNFEQKTISETDTVVDIYYTRNQYTLTFDENVEEGDAEGTLVYYGEAITAPANPTRTGYTFGGWDKTVPTTMPDEDVTITAKWNINQYTITFNTDGGTEIAVIEQDYGTAVTAPADPTRTGYTFTGWDKAIPTTMPAENMTITAKWNINQYTITFDTDGGTEIDAITQNYGTAVTAPADPAKYGYTFAGWDTEIPTTMPAEDMTITAQWNAIEYTITFDTAGGDAMSPITQGYGSELSVTAPTKTGYIFSGWVDGDGNAYEIPTTMPDENVSLTATWTINQYTLTIMDGETTKSSWKENYGENIEYSTSKDGYTFEGFLDQAGNEVTIPFTMPANDLTLYINWDPIEYIAYFDGNVDYAGGVDHVTRITDAPDQQVFTYDDLNEVLLSSIFTASGYTFTGWNTTANGTGTSFPSNTTTTFGTLKDTFTANRTSQLRLYAQWEDTTYTIEYSGVDESYSGPTSYSRKSESITLPTPTKAGYTFTGWTGTDLSSPTMSVTISPASEKNYTFTANWEAIQYKITYELGTTDTVTNDNPSTYTIEEANGITFTEPTRDGYKFLGWYTDSAFTTATTGLPANSTGDYHAYAKWIRAIDSEADLIAFANEVNALTSVSTESVILTGSFTLTEKWNTYINKDLADPKYKGTFDGGGYTITNNSSYPIFGENWATIKNLNVVVNKEGLTYSPIRETETSNTCYYGILAAINDGGTIEKCTVTTTVPITVAPAENETFNTLYVGGMVGQTYSGTISDSSFSGPGTINVTATADQGAVYVGGIAGRLYDGTIKNCTVTQMGVYCTYGDGIGGICGYVGSGTISGCTVEDITINADVADAALATYVGGIAGYCSAVTLTNCSVKSGTIYAGDYAGGIIGYLGSSGTVTECEAGSSETSLEIYYVTSADNIGVIYGNKSEAGSGYVTITQKTTTG